MKRNIVLTGFMGVGKSLVSKDLGDRLNCRVFSTDAEVERQEGKTIPHIFQEKGEAYFRELERKVVAEIVAAGGAVIDCGGGVVLSQNNIDVLRKNGLIFNLYATPERILKNIRLTGQPRRPLLEVEDPLARIRELLNERESWYAQADYRIDTTEHTIKQTADAIMDILNNE